jgi:hypothetical protein
LVTVLSKVTMIGDPTPMVSAFSLIGVMSAMPSGAFLALTLTVAALTGGGASAVALGLAGCVARPVPAEQALTAARARKASETLTVRLRGFTVYS